MASASFNTLVSDVVVPSIFTPYIQQQTEVKSRLIQSGIIQRSAFLDNFLAGGGLTCNVPSWKDVADDADNVSTDATADYFAHILNGTSIDLTVLSALSDSRPKAIGTATEIATRLNRNKSWASGDLVAVLAGADPMASIANRVSDYWKRRLQDIFIAMMKGISKDNGVNDSGDYAYSIIGASFVDGVTNFNADAFIDACLTAGDSADQMTACMMHSVVYGRALKNNLIDFIPDAINGAAVRIPTFLGRQVIVDDNMPNGTSSVTSAGVAGAAGCYETWIFGPGAFQLGVGTPKVATEIDRQPQAGNGGGQEILYNRQEWSLHPVGHAYVGTSPNGGPSNAASTNNLNIATSWDRRYTERKQIKIARLITRES